MSSTAEYENDSPEFKALLRVLDDLALEGYVIYNDHEDLRRLADRIYQRGTPPTGGAS